MEETTTQPQDAPVVDQPQTEPTQAAPTAQDEQPTVQPQDTSEAPEAAQPVETATAEPEVGSNDDEFEYPNVQIPQAQPIDFNNLPVGEDNLIDPNALAGSINQAIATAEERAALRAQQAYAEQRAEEKGWEKAYEKYPELKTNKELRDLVHRTRLGEVTDMLGRTQDPSSVKLPTPAQIADRFFKYIGNAKQEGVKQATENTVIQASAHVETASRVTDDAADEVAKLRQNINNPNKEVAKEARNKLLQKMLGM